MSISNGVAYLLSTSTIAGTTAAKAALTGIVLSMGAFAAAFISALASSFRKSSRRGLRTIDELTCEFVCERRSRMRYVARIRDSVLTA